MGRGHAPIFKLKGHPTRHPTDCECVGSLCCEQARRKLYDCSAVYKISEKPLAVHNVCSYRRIQSIVKPTGYRMSDESIDRRQQNHCSFYLRHIKSQNVGAHSHCVRSLVLLFSEAQCDMIS